jgi:hypothetical protein
MVDLIPINRRKMNTNQILEPCNDDPKELHKKVGDCAARAQSLEVGRASVASNYRVYHSLHGQGTFANGTIPGITWQTCRVLHYQYCVKDYF